MVQLSYFRYEYSIMTHIQMRINWIYTSIFALKEDVDTLYEYMQVLSTQQLNPLIMPPDILHLILDQVVDRMIGTVYLNIPLSSASLHGHPQSSLGATLGVRMSLTAYGNLSTMSCVWPIGTSRLNLRPCPLSI